MHNRAVVFLNMISMSSHVHVTEGCQGNALEKGESIHLALLLSLCVDKLPHQKY